MKHLLEQLVREEKDNHRRRNLFDLVWYLSDPQWPAPNLVLLNNSLRQFGWSGPELVPQ